MHYIAVNLDKKEYFRPVALGAPLGSKRWGVTAFYDPNDWQWLILLAQFLELNSLEILGNNQPWWLGTWAGNRILILRSNDDSGSLLPKDLQAMKAMGAPNISSYKTLRKELQDLTGKLKTWMEKHLWMGDRLYANLTRSPWDYHWMTLEDVDRCLADAKEEGVIFYNGYVPWLAGRYNLRPEVKARVEKVAAGILESKP